MRRQPEQLTGVCAVGEHVKAVNQMALLNRGGIDGETGMDMLGWGRPKDIVGTQWGAEESGRDWDRWGS